MDTLNLSKASESDQTTKTAQSLSKLYFIRAAFSIIWVILVFAFVEDNQGFAKFLLIIYPLWDAIATLFDIKSTSANSSKVPQYVNAGISVVTTIAVYLALQTGIAEALIVFGIWAISAGLIQLILAVRRRKEFGGQWPLIISGGQSMLGGISFIVLAHAPTSGIKSLAGYAAFGAFYFLLAAFRLTKAAAKATN
jgi:uncharacterized membrane protein HdeD (DUF308 family)